MTRLTLDVDSRLLARSRCVEQRVSPCRHRCSASSVLIGDLTRFSLSRSALSNSTPVSLVVRLSPSSHQCRTGAKSGIRKWYDESSPRQSRRRSQGSSSFRSSHAFRRVSRILERFSEISMICVRDDHTLRFFGFIMLGGVVVQNGVVDRDARKVVQRVSKHVF